MAATIVLLGFAIDGASSKRSGAGTSVSAGSAFLPARYKPIPAFRHGFDVHRSEPVFTERFPEHRNGAVEASPRRPRRSRLSSSRSFSTRCPAGPTSTRRSANTLWGSGRAGRRAEQPVFSEIERAPAELTFRLWHGCIQAGFWSFLGLSSRTRRMASSNQASLRLEETMTRWTGKIAGRPRFAIAAALLLLGPVVPAKWSNTAAQSSCFVVLDDGSV